MPAPDNKLYTLEHLILADKLEGNGSSGLVVASILSIAALILFSIIWSIFTPNDEMVTIEGTVEPNSNVYIIQHPEGGKVLAVNKDDGEFVRSGDILLELSGENLTHDLQRFKSTDNVLAIDIMRLQAFISDKPLAREYLYQKLRYKNAIPKESLMLLIDNAVLLYQHQRDLLLAQKRDLQTKIINQKNNFKDIEVQLQHLQNKREIVAMQMDMYKKLLATQSISKANYLSFKEKNEDIIAEILRVERERTNILSAISELEMQLQNNKLQIIEDSLKELKTLSSDWLENNKQLSKLNERINNLKIIAPVTGYIKGLDIKPGSVIKPADEILEIVPLDKALTIHAKMPPLYVGRVKINDITKIKVSAYDYALYGKVSGKVRQISPSTFIDRNNLPYYKVEVFVEKNYIGSDPNLNPILPGMTVSVDIKTGSRSLFKYFIKPIGAIWYSSFREK